ncbi:response regulator [Bacillus sp. B1-b2]|uniref:response regulator n=1 Tax=Bacillus sp. B1-b2 TaxID=2653201 RepID=UPI00126170BD|nr:response regulator [Bacillus sp. B1-b2]KAB7666898.1 response regulator [Bacillus sp. B1-b2]
MKRLLLAEDEEVLRMLIVDTLEDDYSIDEAQDGEEALGLIEQNEYDLLILDYMMPIMTGLEVIEKVRGNEEKKHLKILMLSAKSQTHEQQDVIAAGADYFMAKPFSPLALLNKVEEILDEY